MKRNLCKYYEHIDEAQYPENDFSCRGCKNSIEPSFSGSEWCNLSTGFVMRDLEAEWKEREENHGTQA